MGRAPCCSVEGLKKGAWTEEDDRKLVDYIAKHGEGGWRSLPQKAGLLRCGKSCRLRWANYLKPGIKRGEFSPEEEETIIRLHSNLGNKWSAIAKHLPMRTDNEIKNYWNTQLKRRAAEVCDRNAEQGNEKNNAEAANGSTTSTKKELIESGILKGPISTPSKLLNEVAAKLRGSSSLALFMSQKIGKPKSLESSSVPNACSAHLLNKMASNLNSSSPKSHSLSAIRAIFSTSLEGDHNVGVSTSTTSGSTNSNGPMGSPQSENAMQVLSPRTVSASASLLNRMATKLALASESSLLMGDHSPLEMSHFDGTSASDNTGYPRNMAIEIDDRDDQPFFMDISDDHDDQKERELMGSFSSDEQVSVFTSGSDSYGGCSTPHDHVEAIVGELEAAKNWTDSCIFIEELFNNAEIL